MQHKGLLDRATFEQEEIVKSQPEGASYTIHHPQSSPLQLVCITARRCEATTAQPPHAVFVFVILKLSAQLAALLSLITTNLASNIHIRAPIPSPISTSSLLR